MIIVKGSGLLWKEGGDDYYDEEVGSSGTKEVMMIYDEEAGSSGRKEVMMLNDDEVGSPPEGRK